MTLPGPPRLPLVAVAILLLGLLQMAGDLLHVPAMKGVGAASMISPAPKVFSSVKGLETYSTRTFLEWTDRMGESHSLLFDSQLYAKLQGPYNRRNVYGAALAYGPVLAQDDRLRPMLRAVTTFALTGEAPLLVELGIDPATVTWPLAIRYEPIADTEMGDLPHTLEIPLP
jgi:hypothetical protein